MCKREEDEMCVCAMQVSVCEIVCVCEVNVCVNGNECVCNAKLNVISVCVSDQSV